MELIIDGYNLIFQCGLEGRSADSRALERARNRLVSELSRLVTAEPGTKCTVVFDAKNRPVQATESEYFVDGIRILFATEFEEADAQIELLIRQNSAPKNLVVVSSDHRLHKAALARRATPVDSDVWYEKAIEEAVPAKPAIPLQNPETPSFTAQEKAALVEEFQIPVQELNELDNDAAVDVTASASDEFGLEQGLIDELNPDLDELNPFPPGYGEDLLE